ncbi:hypothetical protein F5I97DRAFT_1830158 [Phlebopus sp. FC_14]|nr:hypothetical protein F5I97DRAFT_1830158 [Phlebopus sp. FC_14]
MPYQWRYSADIAFKIKSASTGLVFYGIGDVVTLGPDVPADNANLWRANPANNGVQNVASGKYITAEGKLSDIPQDWDLISIGGDDYNIKIPDTDLAVTIVGDGIVALPLGSGDQAFQLQFQVRLLCTLFECDPQMLLNPWVLSPKGRAICPPRPSLILEVDAPDLSESVDKPGCSHDLVTGNVREKRRSVWGPVVCTVSTGELLHMVLVSGLLRRVTGRPAVWGRCGGVTHINACFHSRQEEGQPTVLFPATPDSSESHDKETMSKIPLAASQLLKSKRDWCYVTETVARQIPMSGKAHEQKTLGISPIADLNTPRGPIAVARFVTFMDPKGQRSSPATGFLPKEVLKRRI